MKATKNNNYGRGFWYQFSDGYETWCLGMSAQELKRETAKHGKLVERKPA